MKKTVLILCLIFACSLIFAQNKNNATKPATEADRSTATKPATEADKAKNNNKSTTEADRSTATRPATEAERVEREKNADGSVKISDSGKITTCTLNVKMDCAGCEAKVKKQLAFVKGVKDVETSLDEQKVVVKYLSNETTPDILVGAVNELGYKVSIATTANTATEKNTSNCNHKKEGCATPCNKDKKE